MAHGDNGAISAIGAKDHGPINREIGGLSGGVSLTHQPQVPQMFGDNSNVHLTAKQKNVSLFT